MARHRGKNNKHKPATAATKPQLAKYPEQALELPWWKRSHRTLYAALGVAAVFVALMQGYPWLSIHENGLLDPSNAYSQMFSVSNGGYVPVTDLDAVCTMNTQIGHVHFGDNRAIFRNFVDYLAHDGSATIPCFRGFALSNPPSGSTLDIKIDYALYHLNVRPLRRSQTFHFKSVVGSDNSQHWIFL